MFPRIFAFALLVLTASSSQATFDYIIVGAGPAGLVLANRLSEDSSISVAIIEAGDEQYSNPNVTRVDTFFPGLGTSIDWNYVSAPQKYTSNATVPYHSGKALGGTTTINGMTYLRAEKEQIDQWEKFDNEGWNWDTMYKYYRSQEHFQPPSKENEENGAIYDKSFHGFNGEVAVGWNKYFLKEGLFKILKDTSEKLGIKWNKDANGGRMSGFSAWPFTQNSTTNTRQDAARSFYYPIAGERSNLKVFLNTTATKIVWAEKSEKNEDLVAEGLEILTSTNEKSILCAKEEVILSAGSLRSPALLEHSGVGNPAVLKPLGIETKLNLPSVGANLQDQPSSTISYSSTQNWTGYPSFVTYLTALDLFGADLEALTSEIKANLSQYAQQIVADAPSNETTVEIEEELMKLELDLTFTKTSTVPLAELLMFPNGNGIACVFWNLLPFSRGSIHINSTDPTLQPVINPNFLQLPIDTLVQAAIATKARAYFASRPLSEYVTQEDLPGANTVPLDADWRDERWAEWIRATLAPNSHPVSSTAMRSRQFGGVVDSEGKVYGIKNVRVVDAGIFPGQISGHLSASVYAVAGKIADGMTRR